MKSPKGIVLSDLNASITCKLCSGYYVDATTLVDCMHTFCRGCILKHFENNKMECPTCKKKNHNSFRPDLQLQSLVYKLVPGLYAKEMQRREEFYRSTRVRASSSCSDDSVLGDMMQDHEEWVNSNVGDDNKFLSPDDSISLSLEYYQYHMDDTATSNTPNSATPPAGEVSATPNSELIKNNDPVPSEPPNNNNDGDKAVVKKDDVVEHKDCEKELKDASETADPDGKEEKIRDRRYLQCPAAVSMTHLQKFLRMKYALSQEHKVDIIYEGEILPSHFSLIDVAYTFKWQRVKPMRFFYRIFTPMKIRPIKIINTSSSGQKQLQIVPVKPAEHKLPSDDVVVATPAAPQDPTPDPQIDRNKERLMAELQLQSKTKLPEPEETKAQIPRYGKTYENPAKNDKKKHAPDGAECVYDYEETDKEEMKKFAESRDREWQLLKHPDDEHRVSKKRKKSKHSKNDVTHKKRKLHAEITKSEESLKLKVKLTPHNGHKHKHHKNQAERPIEASNKEKLLQMRQIRHKNVGDEAKKENSDAIAENQTKNTETQTKSSETQTKIDAKAVEIQTKSSETQTNPLNKTTSEAKVMKIAEGKKLEKIKEVLTTGKTLRSDFPIKTTASRDLYTMPSSVQIERNELVEKHAQKSFLKTFQSYTDKQIKKCDVVKIENAKKIVEERKIAQNKSLLQQQQFSRLAQQCTIKPKETQTKPENNAKRDKKVTFSGDKTPQILNTQYHHPGFTVSKIETGVKRKPEIEESVQDKRPSLEITLINPAVVAAVPPKQSPATSVKRPPPPTIPLERIKKSCNSGVSIIPKMPEKCEIGPLDLTLSKPHKSIEITKPNGLTITNGLKLVVTPDKVQLSNLQMLSKVASEHQSLKKPMPNQPNKPKPQMPNLQTIKIPNPANQPKPNLAKIPKLNEINKSQFKAVNSLRNMRPNQNQSIRNIPNPSLLVRQQNQSRLNLVQGNVEGKETKAPPPVSVDAKEVKPAEKVEAKKS